MDSVAFFAVLEANTECFELDEREHVLRSSMCEFSCLEYGVKSLCADFESMGVSGFSGRSDATLFVHITLGPVYFQYTSSRPLQSYTVVSLPGIQLTPNKVSPTGGRGRLDLLDFGCIFDDF